MKLLAILVLLFVFPAVSVAQVVKELVGRYQMDVQGGDILELRANGSATLAGDETQWSATGNRLRVGADVMTYSLQAGHLVLTMGSVQIAWKRIGGAAKGSSSALPQQPTQTQQTPAHAAAPAAGGNAQDAEARQVLTGSAWCS
ncbi:MAG: hypothetical protein ACHQIO_02810, partial [Nevskiales bacterium]